MGRKHDPLERASRRAFLKTSAMLGAAGVALASGLASLLEACGGGGGFGGGGLGEECGGSLPPGDCASDYSYGWHHHEYGRTAYGYQHECWSYGWGCDTYGASLEPLPDGRRGLRRAEAWPARRGARHRIDVGRG
jgi:hypothetical protein